MLEDLKEWAEDRKREEQEEKREFIEAQKENEHREQKEEQQKRRRGRKPKEPKIYTRILKKKKLEDISIINSCCKKRCCHLYITQKLISQCRLAVHNLPTESDRRAYIRAKLGIVGPVSNPESSQIKPKPTIDGMKVCMKIFSHAYGVSKSLIYNSMRGITRAYSSRASLKEQSVLMWLDSFKQMHEHMPDTDEVQVPYSTAIQVYQLYVREVEEEEGAEGKGGDPVAYSYFVKLWKTHRSSIVLRKCLRFAMCNTCTDLREKQDRTVDTKVVFTFSCCSVPAIDNTNLSITCCICMLIYSLLYLLGD